MTLKVAREFGKKGENRERGEGNKEKEDKWEVGRTEGDNDGIWEQDTERKKKRTRLFQYYTRLPENK